MTTQVYAISDGTPEVVVPLRGKGTIGSIEVAFQGDIGGGTIGAFRRFLNDAGAAIGEDVALAYSWKDQTAAVIIDARAGLTLKNLQPESAIVFVLDGATGADGNIILLGLS